MVTEITVSVKGEDRTYKQNFLVYEQVTWNDSDPVLKKCINEALSNAKIEPEKIVVRARLDIN